MGGLSPQALDFLLCHRETDRRWLDDGPGIPTLGIRLAFHRPRPSSDQKGDPTPQASFPSLGRDMNIMDASVRRSRSNCDANRPCLFGACVTLMPNRAQVLRSLSELHSMHSASSERSSSRLRGRQWRWRALRALVAWLKIATLRFPVPIHDRYARRAEPQKRGRTHCPMQLTQQSMVRRGALQTSAHQAPHERVFWSKCRPSMRAKSVKHDDKQRSRQNLVVALKTRSPCHLDREGQQPPQDRISLDWAGPSPGKTTPCRRKAQTGCSGPRAGQSPPTMLALCCCPTLTRPTWCVASERFEQPERVFALPRAYTVIWRPIRVSWLADLVALSASTRRS